VRVRLGEDALDRLGQEMGLLKAGDDHRHERGRRIGTLPPATAAADAREGQPPLIGEHGAHLDRHDRIPTQRADTGAKTGLQRRGRVWEGGREVRARRSHRRAAHQPPLAPQLDRDRRALPPERPPHHFDRPSVHPLTGARPVDVAAHERARPGRGARDLLDVDQRAHAPPPPVMPA
jgi:hypothetical protein